MAIQQDQYSGDVYLVQGNQVRLWDPPTSTPYSYTWTSKEFDLPKPVNFGAMRLKFAGGGFNIPAQFITDYTNFNNARIAYPLNPINGSAINGVRTKVIAGSILPQIRNPINGSPLYPIGTYTNVNGAVQVTIYARDLVDQQWQTVFNWSVNSERTFRLPAGLKSDGWQVRLVGNVPVYSFAMAETGKELQQV